MPKQSPAQNREGRDSFTPRRVEVLNPKHQILNADFIEHPRKVGTISKFKNQNDKSKRKNVVRGFSLVHERKAASRVVEITPCYPPYFKGERVHDPEGSHYKNVEHLRQPG